VRVQEGRKRSDPEASDLLHQLNERLTLLEQTALRLQQQVHLPAIHLRQRGTQTCGGTLHLRGRGNLLQLQAEERASETVGGGAESAKPFHGRGLPRIGAREIQWLGLDQHEARTAHPIRAVPDAVEVREGAARQQVRRQVQAPEIEFLADELRQIVQRQRGLRSGEQTPQRSGRKGEEHLGLHGKTGR